MSLETISGKENVKKPRRVIAGSSIGGVVEWFDFTLFGLTAPLLARVFFPESAGTSALVMTFAVYAVAFVARPVGAVVFGQIGDRIGRRPALSASIILMGVATAAIGLLPGYQTIGVAAPLLLILARLLQGFSAGGELTGALVFSHEHAPATRRGRWVGIVSGTTMLGPAGAAALVLGFQLMSGDWFEAGGWRWTFIIAGSGALVGIYLRLKVEETPDFQATQRDKPALSPFSELVRDHRRVLVIQFAYFTVAGLVVHTLVGYVPTYLIEVAEVTSIQSSYAFISGALVAVLSAILTGRMVDRVGWLIIVRAAVIWTIASTVPAFILMGTGLLVPVVLGLAILGISAGMFGACMVATLELLPARVRYSGTALPYNVAYAVFAGTAPLVSTWLIDASENSISPAIYTSVITVLAAPVLLATLSKQVHEIDRESAAHSARHRRSVRQDEQTVLVARQARQDDAG